MCCDEAYMPWKGQLMVLGRATGIVVLHES